MTQDGSPVASSSYNLYGSTKESTDTTGNPFAYNGEARDVTGLDYLRARYYDSSTGTFLTEDSYQGELTDPLSQNLYSYVHNNPVNYTDPSGHIWKSIKTVASNAWNGAKKVATNTWNTVKRVATNTWNTVKSAASHATNWVSNKVNQAVNWVGTQVNWVGRKWNNIYHAGQQAYQSASDYAQAQYQQMQAQIQAQREQAVRDEFTQATGIKGTPKSREGQNLLRNWGSALAKTLKHVCTTAERVGKQTWEKAQTIDWGRVAIVTIAVVAAVAVTALTAGAAAPFISSAMGVTSSAIAMGTVSTGTMIAIGVGTGAVSGAAGGAAYGYVEGILSGRDSETINQNMWNGAINGFVSGGLTGGLLGSFGAATSSVTNSAARHVLDTVGETAVDTIVDAVQGGQVTPGSIATSLAFNAVTEGITSKVGKGAKADVNTNKPKSGDVPVTKSRKDVTPVQQLSNPGPKSQPLALPAPKQQLALPAPEPVLALPAPHHLQLMCL